jgi:hypothetical protein
MFLFTPFPTFPQGGRSIKTFPLWGKMKGGKLKDGIDIICFITSKSKMIFNEKRTNS